MKLILECQNCRTRMELEPNRGVTYADLNVALQNAGMDLDIDIDDVAEAEDVSDLDIRYLEFRCMNCGEFTTFDL